MCDGRGRGHTAAVVAFAYIALGIPAVLLWWNIALHVRRLAPTRRRPRVGAAPRVAAGVPAPAFAVAQEAGEAA